MTFKESIDRIDALKSECTSEAFIAGMSLLAMLWGMASNMLPSLDRINPECERGLYFYWFGKEIAPDGGHQRIGYIHVQDDGSLVMALQDYAVGNDIAGTGVFKEIDGAVESIKDALKNIDIFVSE